MFSLRLFGGASLEGSHGAVTGRAAKRHRLALLALLATAGRGGVSRDRLIAFLWPEVDAGRGRHLLSNWLYLLRQALGEHAVVGSSDALRLEPDRVACDVPRFEEAIEEGALERAVGLYTGPFLDGFFLGEVPERERWIEQEREHLAAARGRALEGLAAAAEGEGELARAVHRWKTRAAQDPGDSRVALRLMLALEASGNRAGALQHAAIHERLIREQFGAPPPPEVQALAERLRREPIASPRPDASRLVESPPAESRPDEPLPAAFSGSRAPGKGTSGRSTVSSIQRMGAGGPRARHRPRRPERGGTEARAAGERAACGRGTGGVQHRARVCGAGGAGQRLRVAGAERLGVAAPGGARRSGARWVARRSALRPSVGAGGPGDGDALGRRAAPLLDAGDGRRHS